jgi:hypothetical protein
MVQLQYLQGAGVVYARPQSRSFHRILLTGHHLYCVYYPRSDFTLSRVKRCDQCELNVVLVRFFDLFVVWAGLDNTPDTFH